MICFSFFMICFYSFRSDVDALFNTLLECYNYKISIYIFLSIFYALYNINLKSRVIPSEKVNFFIFFEKVENEYDKNRAGEMFLGAFLSC